MLDLRTPCRAAAMLAIAGGISLATGLMVTAGGAAQAQASVSTMDLVADQYGETNRSVNARIKQALDPNHIIAPGKQGIA